MIRPKGNLIRRWRLIGATATALALSCAVPRAAGASVTVSVSYFYDDLSPYGRWIDEPRYGWCWTPYRVASAWRPYSDGYWVYSDLGWTWVSYEPWGWASYH